MGELERYGVLLAMAETAFEDIEGAVSLEFCRAMAAIFKTIPSRISFGLPPEAIYEEVLAMSKFYRDKWNDNAIVEEVYQTLSQGQNPDSLKYLFSSP